MPGLPNPGMNFTPFDPLAASELNDIVENVESVSDGSGFALDDNVIPANALATSAITLGLAVTTTNTTVATGAVTQIAGLSITVTIPAGGRKVRISTYLPGVYNNSVANTNLYIFEGSVAGSELNRGVFTAAGSNYATSLTLSAISTPSAGSKTYVVGGNTSAGTGGVILGGGGTAYILVEAI